MNIFNYICTQQNIKQNIMIKLSISRTPGSYEVHEFHTEDELWEYVKREQEKSFNEIKVIGIQ